MPARALASSRRGVLRAITAGVLLTATPACGTNADPLAIASSRTPSTTALPAPGPTTSDDPIQVEPSTLPIEMSRSTSSGDVRYPGLGSADIDVGHYDLSLRYDAATLTISGVVEVTGSFLHPTDQIALDARGPVVESVSGPDGALTFEQADGELVIALGEPHPAGDAFAVADRVPGRGPAPRRLLRTCRAVRRNRGAGCLGRERAGWHEHMDAGQRSPDRQGDMGVRDHRAQGVDGGGQRNARGRGRRGRGLDMDLETGRTDGHLPGDVAHRRLRAA